MREAKAGIFEKALADVSAALDAERAKDEATRQGYLDKIHAHSARDKPSLGLDKILGEEKVELDKRERDMGLRETVLVEAQTRGLNPRDNHNELMELVELQRLLQDTEVDCVIEACRLVTLVRDVSKVLEDHGMSPIPGIPRDPCTASDILGVVDIILEDVKEAYNSGYGPWD
jgi:hypothetical protein